MSLWASLWAWAIIAVHPDIAWAGAPTFLRPESTTAQEINSLAIKLLIICAVVLMVVEGLLVTAIIRFRRRREEDVRQIHGNTTLEIVWTLIPAVLIAIILTFTVRTMNTLDLPGGDVPMQVTGHQWWWEVHYPQAGVTAANEIHLPTGRSVDLSLASADVIHSFWVPQLGGKTDAVPGHTNRVTFLAATPGLYQGQCAEFCGLQHAHMRFDLVVESPAEFSAWLAHQAEPAAKPSGAVAQRGGQLFLANPCVGCHAVRGTPAAGVIGPDLTHFASRRMLAAGSIENTQENLERWLRDPQAIKPGALMASPKLNDADRAAVVAYLEGLE